MERSVVPVFAPDWLATTVGESRQLAQHKDQLRWSAIELQWAATNFRCSAGSTFPGRRWADQQWGRYTARSDHPD